MNLATSGLDKYWGRRVSFILICQTNLEKEMPEMKPGVLWLKTNSFRIILMVEDIMIHQNTEKSLET